MTNQPTNPAANPKTSESLPRVVIVGAGFGGLNAAQALAKAPVQITVIDRANFHTFQPLLYQVPPPASLPEKSPRRSAQFCARIRMYKC